MEELNNILNYLQQNRSSSFKRRTKRLLKDHSNQLELLDNHLSKLMRDGYIMSFFHPSIGLLWEKLKIEPDQKIFYSVTKRGIKFLKRGGYR